MEPRPPRPRSSRQFETPGPPPTPGIGERLYPAATDQTYYPGAETYEPSAAEPPLLPRQQRRQRQALRGIGAGLLLIALIVALGWLFRDTIRGIISPPPPPPTVIAENESNVVAPATPAAPTAAALPNALATVTPTAAAAATATRAPEVAEEQEQSAEESLPASDEPDRDISAQTLPLLDFLPTQDQVPAGMILADEAERSEAEVVDALGGTEEAAQLLEGWGWSGNAFRDFVVPQDGEAPPSGTTFLNVSVHRFADPESAANAMVFFSDQVIFSQGLQEVEAPAVGEIARLLVGAPDGVPLTILYAQSGPIMYRIGGSSNSAEGDATPDVLAVATAIIPGQADGG